MKWKKERWYAFKWHPYFAWFPVTASGHGVWMETIERKFGFYGWEYRLPLP